MRLVTLVIATVAVLAGILSPRPAEAQTCSSPGACGGQAPSGCFCDLRCLQPGFHDCCSDVLTACKVPVITTLSPTTGSTTGGYPATVTGNNFDNSNTSGTSTVTTVTIGGQSCTVGSLSTTSLSCTVPQGVGRNNNVAVTTTWTTYLGTQTLTGTSPTAATRFSYTAPQLTALSPSSMPTVGGTLTITGTNLGATGATATVGGVNCPVTAQTHTQVQCTMAAGTGVNRAVVLTVGGQTSNTLTVSYAPPSIASFSGPRGTAGGTALTISGANFGPSSATVAVTIGGVACPVTSHDHSQIVCTLPAGQGTVPVIATVGGQSSAPVSFTYNAPSISSVSPSALPTAGGALTINGVDFGTSGTVTIDGATCAITSYAQNRIVCTAPAGVGASHVLTVTVGGQTATTSIGYAAPVLTSLSAPNRPTQGGVTITLVGTNLGASGATVTIGGVACPVTAQTHTQVSCRLPEGQGTGLSVLLTVGGQTSNALGFAYDPPQIIGLSPTSGPTEGGPLVISGVNFGVFGATVTVGGVACPVQSASHTSITCTTPPAVGVDQPVVVTVAGQSSAPAFFDRNPPSLTSLSPDHGPMAGGTTLTLAGADFGAAGATVTVGGNDCPVVTQDHHSATCTLPAGTGKNVPVVLSVGGQTSNSLPFDYDAPAITVDPAQLAFGDVLIGGAGGDRTLTVTNSGQVDLQVTAIDVSGSQAAEFTVVSPALPVTVPPGMSQVVTVHLAPTAHGSRSATLTLHSNAVVNPDVTVAMVGKGVAPVLTAGASLDFGSSNVDVAVTRSVTVSNPGERDLIVSQVALSGPDAGDFAVTTSLPVTIAPGGSGSIAMRFRPAAVGARSATASIVANDPLRAVADVDLSGEGTSPSLSIAPSSVDFGDVRIDAGATARTVTLHNGGSGPLTITGVSLGGTGAADFAVDAITLPFVLAAGGDLTLNLSYDPASVGGSTATLQITSDDPVASSVEVPLAGNAVSPVFSLDPSALDFGGQVVGRASAARRIVVHNDGTSALGVTGVEVTGPDAAAFAVTSPSLPASVAPGATLEIPVVFTAAGVGSATATLTITTDDPTAPTGNVVLTAAGLSQILAVSPLAIDFGVIEAPGHATDVTVTVQNLGGDPITLQDGVITGASPDVFAVTSLAGSLAPGASRTAMVSFTTDSAGTYAAQLTIHADEAGLPDVVVPLTGKAVSSLLAVAPESLDFGDVEVGSTSAALTLTITNQSGQALSIDRLGLDDAEFSVSGVTLPASLDPGASLDVSVTFAPTSAGAHAASLEIGVAGQSAPEAIVALGGTGTAPPGADAGPGTPDAGPVEPGQDAGVSVGGGGGCGCRVGEDDGGAPWGGLALLGVVALLGLERRRRSRTRRD